MAFPVAGSFQKWPNGASGDLTVSSANEYMDFSQATSALNYRNVTINSGCTLWIRVTDGYPAILGVAGNLTVNGSIKVIDKNTDSLWPNSTALVRTLPTLNKQIITFTTPIARLGGGSGLKGFGVGGKGGDYLSELRNVLGGSGGGYNTNGSNGNIYNEGGSAPIAGTGGTNASNASNGTAASTVSPSRGGNGGGRNYNNGDFGGSGSGCGGGGGGAAANPFGLIVGGGGGGSGGWPGRNGAGIFILVQGYISGSGSISAAGEVGRAGFNGGTADGQNFGTYGGNGGGGGSGGYGGKIIIRYNNFAGIALAVSGANGGTGGTGGPAFGNSKAGSSGAAGSNGTAGTTDAAAS